MVDAQRYDPDDGAPRLCQHALRTLTVSRSLPKSERIKDEERQKYENALLDNRRSSV